MQRRHVLAGLAAVAGGAGVYGATTVLSGSGSDSNGSSGAGSDGEAGTAGGADGTADGTGSDSGSYEPLDYVELDGTRELVTSDDGATAFLAVDDGIATVDCSTPSEPTILAERRADLVPELEASIELLWDVSLSGDRLLAVAPAQNVMGDSFQGALLFDVADPADPQLLDVFETDYPIHNCYLEDGVAYLTANGGDGNPLAILDAGGDSLAELARWSIFDVDQAWSEVPPGLRQLHDVTVQDGVAYLPYWDAGTYLLDVSDPAEPGYLGHTAVRERSELTGLDGSELQRALFSPPGNSHFVQPDETGELLAVGREAWSVEIENCARGSAAGIDLYDVSDPTAIEHQATIEPPTAYNETQDGWFTTAHNFDLRDGRLYSSWYFGGVKVHDVDDPTIPEELAWWRDPQNTSFWTAQCGVPGEYFLASSAADAAGYGYGIPGRVYVFPDREGQQPDPPDLTDPPVGEERLEDC